MHPTVTNVCQESLDQQISTASYRVDIARNNMFILQQKVQRRLETLSKRLSNIKTAIEESFNRDESLLAANDRLEPQIEKFQLTWGQRLNMAESGIEYEIMAMEKLLREQQALKTRVTPAKKFESSGQNATSDEGQWNDGPI